MKKLLFAFTLVFVVAAEQDTSSVLQALDGKLPTNLIHELPSLSEGDEMLKEKCLKNGNNETYDRFVEGKEEFRKCVQDLFDFDKMKKEIEQSKPNGNLDEVFHKYCSQKPKLKGCIESFLNVSEPCFDESEKSHKTTIMNVTMSIMNFVCYKDGDRIALFVAEGGPECIENNFDNVMKCVNETASSYTEDGSDMSEDLPQILPQLLLDEKQCTDINKVQKCIVNYLEKCKEPTPANIVGSMFDFVKKNTPCKKHMLLNSNSSPYLSVSTLALVTPIVAYVVANL